MDEQRCELPKPIEKSKSTEDMLDMVERVQGDRMEEQRSDLPTDDDPSQMPVLSTFDCHTLYNPSNTFRARDWFKNAT